MLVLVLGAAACRGEGRSAPSESFSETPAVLSAASAATAAPEVADVPEVPAEACSLGQPLSPATLAASWPTRIGSRVRFKGRVDVAIDVMTAVVVAGGHRFAVVASPDQLWQGDKERSYTVMGSKAVALGGRTALAHLLLEPECTP